MYITRTLTSCSGLQTPFTYDGLWFTAIWLCFRKLFLNKSFLGQQGTKIPKLRHPRHQPPTLPPLAGVYTRHSQHCCNSPNQQQTKHVAELHLDCGMPGCWSCAPRVSRLRHHNGAINKRSKINTGKPCCSSSSRLVDSLNVTPLVTLFTNHRSDGEVNMAERGQTNLCDHTGSTLL